jgi:N-acetylglucosamine-6-phosphate deacetylase
MLIKNARLITHNTALEQGWLLWRDGIVTAMGRGNPPPADLENTEIIDANGLIVAPGFIDIHTHGAAGHDTMDATPDALCKMAQFYAKHGTTAFLATTWTDSGQRIGNALKNAASCVGQQEHGATLLGVHLEGPYLNPAKCGAQNTDYIRRAERDEALKWLDFDVIRLLALTPEYAENQWLIGECVKRGITVSVAHTNATYEDMQNAVGLGIRHATHTFNAMTGLHHREPGVVGAVLSMPEIRCELIADTIHVHPAAMSILYAAKGNEGTIIITDSIRGTGMPDGEYAIDDRKIEIENGAARLEDGTLAGSTVTMDRAVYHFLQAIDKPFEKAWQTASLNAARAIGVADHKGSLEVGKDADLIIIDDDISIYLTVAEGRVVYREGI